MQPKSDIFLYDTTLRDGSQRKGISLSVADKIKIATLLDELGVPYLECGWPGSNPKDAEFFRQSKRLSFSNSKIVAFGSTRRKGMAAQQDSNLEALLQEQGRQHEIKIVLGDFNARLHARLAGEQEIMGEHVFGRGEPYPSNK